MTQILAVLAARDVEHADELVEWTSNFTAGRFINEDAGFDPYFGAAYRLTMSDPEETRFYENWNEVFIATFGSDAQSTGELNGSPSSGGGYAAGARGGLAGTFSATGSIDVAEAYGFVLAATSGMPITTDPTFAAITPQLSDGTLLRQEHTHLGSDAGELIRGSAANELINGLGGNDELQGGLGIDILLGDAGNDILHGQDGDDYLIGGAGVDWLVAGLGSDQLKGGSGADRFMIDAARSGDVNVVHDFDPTEDSLAIDSSLIASQSAFEQAIEGDAEGLHIALQGGGSLSLLGLSLADVPSIDLQTF